METAVCTYQPIRKRPEMQHSRHLSLNLGVFFEDSLLLRSSLIRIALGDYVLNT